MGNTIYQGKPEYGPHDKGGAVLIQEAGRVSQELPPRFDIMNASPTGFAWSYGGSGPAQLALAILAHASGNDDLALAYHQQFKWDVVAGLPPGPWTLSKDEVDAWLERAVNARRRS